MLTRTAVTLVLGALLAPSAALAQRLDAWVLEHSDGAQSGPLAEALGRAGFSVRALPLDRSPAAIRGLIALGSWSSELDGYAAWLARHGDGLREAIRRGAVILQLAQADQVEKSPSFLPAQLPAARTDGDAPLLRVLRPDHPLLSGAPVDGDGALRLNEKISGWEMFSPAAGFGPLIVSADQRRLCALMEAGFGEGRILLAGIQLESDHGKEGKPIDEHAFRRSFFLGLEAYVRAVVKGTAPAIVLTPTLVAPIPFTPGSWTLAVLPDTQYYARSHPDIFRKQARWLVDNREAQDIRFVLHVGDITDNNSKGQWQRARDAMSILDGRVPYALCSGNHDNGSGGNAKSRASLLSESFPYAWYAGQPTFGGAMAEGQVDNCYHLFEAGGRKWIVVGLEWAPRDKTLEWASSVLRRHPDRTGIVFTHWYLSDTGERPNLGSGFPYETPGTTNEGEGIWQKLVRQHDVRLVFSGHVGGDGAGYLASKNSRAKVCHQMVSNYQFGPLGGGGWMRLLEFRPDGEVVVRTWSPHYQRFFLEPDQQFRFQLD